MVVRVDIPVARLPTGSWLSLPVVVLGGARPGPRIWLSAAIHGDELNGIPIIRNVLRRLDPATLVGDVIAVPVVNVFGLVNQSRYLPDRRDLNRSFPGSKRGSLAAQLAHLFMDEVVRRCDFGIDMHTGSQGRENLPQIRCDLEDDQTRKAARAFGTRVIMHADVRDGSLRAASRALGIRTLLYEAGEAGRFDRSSIEFGVAGVLRVMKRFNMLPETEVPPPAPSPTVVWKTEWVRAKRGGFCELDVKLGDRVRAGQPLGMIFDTLGPGGVSVRSPLSGIVIGRLVDGVLNRGDALVNVGVVGTERG